MSHRAGPYDAEVRPRLSDLIGPHTPVEIGGGDICRAYRAGPYFAKTPLRPDPYLLPVEAQGLRAIGSLAPEVVAVTAEWLVLEWVDEVGPTAGAAAQLGRHLAGLHQRRVLAFGAGPEHGRIGSLPMPAGEYDNWPQMYAELRIRPLADGLPHCSALAEALLKQPGWAGPAEPASLLHGDLWAGNILWSNPPRLVDPACHTGHRETDLAMLALFGTPHLDTILAAYNEVHPLAEGWRDRVGLHQLWPLLVHNRLFGGGYAARAEQIAAGYL